MIFPTGRHHGQDVVLATLSATLWPTQGQSLYQNAIGDTALACFGQIPWSDRQGVRQARRRQSNNVNNDGNDSNGPQPGAQGLPPPPTPGGINDDNRSNPGVPGGGSSLVRRVVRSSPRLIRWPPASHIAWGGTGGGEPLPRGRQRCRRRRQRGSHW
jgi:hypothetical protein